MRRVDVRSDRNAGARDSVVGSLVMRGKCDPAGEMRWNHAAVGEDENRSVEPMDTGVARASRLEPNGGGGGA